ncbi:hypothetical protein AHAS_Ahas13G0338500 [Arachis hypogaea]
MDNCHRRTEKKLSAIIEFITGQLIIPHIITVIPLSYVLFHFFDNNKKSFLNYEDKKNNSIRKFSIQEIFFINLIFQLFNPLILSNFILVRLVNK